MCFQQSVGPKSTTHAAVLSQLKITSAYVRAKLDFAPMNSFYTNFNTIEKKS